MKLEDFLDEIFDMLNVLNWKVIYLDDLVKSSFGETVISIIIDTWALYDYE